MAAVTICSDFGALQNKVCHCFHCFPIYLPWSDGTGPDAMTLVFWMLSFKPTFSLSSFTFIKKLFSSSSLSAIRVVSSHIWGYWYFSWQSYKRRLILKSALKKSHWVICPRQSGHFVSIILIPVVFPPVLQQTSFSDWAPDEVCSWLCCGRERKKQREGKKEGTERGRERKMNGWECIFEK